MVFPTSFLILASNKYSFILLSIINESSFHKQNVFSIRFNKRKGSFSFVSDCRTFGRRDVRVGTLLLLRNFLTPVVCTSICFVPPLLFRMPQFFPQYGRFKFSKSLHLTNLAWESEHPRTYLVLFFVFVLFCRCHEVIMRRIWTIFYGIISLLSPSLFGV